MCFLDEKEKTIVRWKCRRGMLELDLFLLPYFDKHYAAFTREERASFKALLETEDTVLLSWFMQQREPSSCFKELIAHIRQSRYAQLDN